MRLTKNVIEHLLALNDGFQRTTHFTSKNSSESRTYLIANGQLHVRAVGNTSWADSRYDDSFIADIDQTRRFLRKYEHELRTDGID